MPEERLTRQEIEATRIFEGGRENTLDRGRATPIIMIPGVMGSRVEFPAFNDKWDPDSVRNMLGWSGTTADRAAQILDGRGASVGQVMSDSIGWEGSLVNIWRAVDPAQDPFFYGRQRGWGGAAKDFYRKLLVALEARYNSGVYTPGQHPVYAFGYDWRKSNANSGALLARRVRYVLQKHGAAKVILVTHSMGGLVARAACSASGIASLVKGIVHVVQPVNGAVMAYRRFAEGVGLDRWADMTGPIMAGIMGGTWWGYSMIMSGTDGPLQLLPNQLYEGWLTMPNGQRMTGAQVYAFYKSGSVESVVPGITGRTIMEMQMEGVGARQVQLRDFIRTMDDLQRERAQRVLARWEEYRRKLLVGLATAQAFHAAMGNYTHPRSFMLYAGDKRTEVGYDWTQSTRPIRNDHGGDATVPVASARGQDAAVQSAWGGSKPPGIALSMNVGAHEHSKVFGGAGVLDRIYARIDALRLLPDA